MGDSPPVIEGEELSFGLIVLETTKASRGLSCSSSAFDLHDLEQKSLKEAHAKYHRNHTLLTYWLQTHIKMIQESWQECWLHGFMVVET